MPRPRAPAATRTRKSRSGLVVVARKGRKTLYLRGSIRGTRIFESAETDDPALAEEVRARRENQLFRADLHAAPARAVSFAEAALSYLEIAPRSTATKIKVGHLLRHFGAHTACDAIDQTAIDQAGYAICPGSKPASVLRQVITPTKAVLNHAARRGWTSPPQFEPVRAGGRRTEWLSPHLAEAMVAAATERFRPLLVFLLGTGARVGEAVSLQWADVDLTHGRAVLRQTKNGDDRIVELAPRVVAALAALPVGPVPGEGDGGRRGHVFLRPGGKPYRATDDASSGAHGGQIKRAFKACVLGAGVAPERAAAITPHVCRHSWASWHYALHRDPLRLQEDGGWRRLEMVRRYAKLVPAGMVPAIAQFLGVAAPGPSSAAPHWGEPAPAGQRWVLAPVEDEPASARDGAMEGKAA